MNPILVQIQKLSAAEAHEILFGFFLITRTGKNSLLDILSETRRAIMENGVEEGPILDTITVAYKWFLEMTKEIESVSKN